MLELVLEVEGEGVTVVGRGVGAGARKAGSSAVKALQTRHDVCNCIGSMVPALSAAEGTGHPDSVRGKEVKTMKGPATRPWFGR
jgi:hypothetical protein